MTHSCVDGWCATCICSRCCRAQRCGDRCQVQLVVLVLSRRLPLRKKWICRQLLRNFQEKTRGQAKGKEGCLRQLCFSRQMSYIIPYYYNRKCSKCFSYDLQRHMQLSNFKSICISSCQISKFYYSFVRNHNRMIICHILVIIVLTEIAYTQKKYVELNINKNQLGLPIVTFCDTHQLLIDTGSEEVWMADNSCRQCYQTLSLCPYITELKKEISYFKGKVKGDYIYLKTCFGQQHKIICAKELQDMNNIQAHGIVGIRGGSTGNSFIKEFMNDNDIQGNSVTVYYGMNEGKVFLGEVPEMYRKEEFVIGDNKNWSLTADKVIIAGIKQIDINCSVHFDTGSNIIILESSLYNAIIQQITSLMSQQGCYKLSPLSYKCYNSFISIDQTLAFTFKGSIQSFHIDLQHLISIQNNIFTFMLDRTDKNICILGVPAFRNYLIQFQMNGRLKIYHSNRTQLTQLEYSNYIYMLLQYVLLVMVLAVVSVRVARLIDEKINRKIVI